MLTVGSLFAGIGGLELGLEHTGGFRTVWQVEIDPLARAVLARWWPHAQRYEDVRSVGPELEPVDVVCLGFPCQDISDAGKRAGLAGARSGLWYEAARILRHLRPAYVLVENVSALRHRGLGEVLGDLAALGYDAEWTSIRAADVGAPHRRDRLFVLAYPARERRREGARDLQPGQPEPPARGEGVADAGRDARLEAERGRPQLAGPDSNGRERLPAPIGRRRGQQPLHQLRPARPPLVYAAGSGQSIGSERDGEPDKGAGALRLHAHRPNSTPWPRPWPPGPTDADGWRGVLTVDPALAPAIRGMAHGIPGRVDRLRLLGNAVVPQVAAIAGRRILELETEAVPVTGGREA